MNELLVNEIYKNLTWQGEGASVGKLCTFIRLAGCPLHCRWCLPGDSRVNTSKYDTKQAKYIQEGDEVLSFSNGELVTGRVEKVFKRKATKELFVRVYTDQGAGLVCTGDHPIFNGVEYVPASSLRVGDSVTRFTSRGQVYSEEISSVQRYEDSEEVYNFEVSPHNNYFAQTILTHNCDSAFTWRFSEAHPHDFAPVYDKMNEVHKMTVPEILEAVTPLDPPMIIISGGEPMVQAKNLPKLINSLYYNVKSLQRIEIETAGVIFDSRVASFDYVFFNVSPKLESSGNAVEIRYKPQVLRDFIETGRATFKFVVCNRKDLQEVDEIVQKVEIPNDKVYIMVEGITEDIQKARMQDFADEILKRRYNFTPRLHVLIWGNRRGV